jgi:ribosome-binding protein aMBF1 (putative translation factor)
MNIKNEIQAALESLGWTPTRLAREAKIRPHMITRILNGQRQGMTLRTYKKLEPFLLRASSAHPSPATEECPTRTAG